ncbi:two-component system sensor histidine kinase NtrB [Brevibacillus invocatus]|uniref:two-component system sensor histidine kinase NtrB n=1 Tax=Brevibacillus invocatus TaxID=173959 RepID=UPI00203DD050|nr:ATP-binding protein [Brevibacillus invocatus]MCM3081096.1 ATP-binding protein [Brevibacillus invocatus]MCM3431415.1 ATP-binding protein [Brevibacillus invocatus]
MKKETGALKKQICLDLMNQASEMEAKTVMLLSHLPPFSTWIQEGQERIQTMLHELITGLIETLETDEQCAIENKILASAHGCGLKGSPVLYLIEPLRTCREVIIERIQCQSMAYVAKGGESSHFYEIQFSLFKLVDDLIYHAVKTYQTIQEESGTATYETSCQAPDVDDFSEMVEKGLVQYVLQSSDTGVLMIDRNLIIREVNEHYAKMFNIKREGLIGRHMDEVFASDVSVRYLQWVIEKGENGYYMFDYEGRWMTVSTSPIYDQGEVCGAIAVLRNITETKRYEEEMTKREALAAVGQLAAGMAHEIRNPLTSIKGFIQLLREQADHEHRDSFYSVILMEVERIDGLLNDVLVLARYRDENIVLEPFPVMDELLGVVRLLEPEANRRGINLELQLETGEWFVHGHRARIKQAFLNILKNAFEAIHTKGKLVQVKVTATAKDIVFLIEDDGPGLTEDNKKNLFVPFYTTKPEGTGLGLSTTQRIIADHGGSIYADNSPRLGGARFEVRLPFVVQ